MTKPPSPLELSAQDGDVRIARVHQSGLSREDAGLVEQIIRLYFWVAFALQEAKRSVKRLRALVFGKGPRVSRPPEAEVAPTASASLDEGAGAGEFRPVDEAFCGLEGATSVTQPGGVRRESPPQPTGGHRPGTGRLGADTYAGAERVTCRHEELAPGQRCPVCGRGSLHALPPGVTIRVDGHALRSAVRYE